MEVYQAYCGGIFKKVKAKKLAHEKIKAIFDRKTKCIGSFLGFQQDKSNGYEARNTIFCWTDVLSHILKLC